MNHGPRALVHGPWFMDHGPWTMVHGPWTTEKFLKSDHTACPNPEFWSGPCSAGPTLRLLGHVWGLGEAKMFTDPPQAS